MMNFYTLIHDTWLYYTCTTNWYQNKNHDVVLLGFHFNISLFFRNNIKFLRFLRKRMNVNPARGPFHHRAPSKIFKRAVRGMLPYKTHRGREALKRVRGFEGVPPRYQRVKKQVAPHAMRVICLAPGRKVIGCIWLSLLVKIFIHVSFFP